MLVQRLASFEDVPCKLLSPKSHCVAALVALLSTAQSPKVIAGVEALQALASSDEARLHIAIKCGGCPALGKLVWEHGSDHEAAIKATRLLMLLSDCEAVRSRLITDNVMPTLVAMAGSPDEQRQVLSVTRKCCVGFYGLAFTTTSHVLKASKASLSAAVYTLLFARSESDVGCNALHSIHALICNVCVSLNAISCIA